MPFVRETEVLEVFETPHDNPPDLALMLTAYMDESSHEAGRVVLAGFIGKREQWSSLEKAWKETLWKFGKRPSLHMKRLRWKGTTKQLLLNLAPVPFDCGLTPLYATVDKDQYADLLTDDLDKSINRTYQVALMPLLLQTLGSFPVEERIKFVFDAQTIYKDFVHLIFRTLKKYKTPSRKPRLAGVEFVSKSILTQPGDYLAYAITQTFRDKHSKKANWCAPIILQMVRSDVEPITVDLRSQEVRDVISWAKAHS
jgi:hypothetical protein